MAEWFERDQHELIRAFRLDNNNVLYIERVAENGFWKVRYKQGATPNAFRGQYTTYEAAYEAVQRHFRSLVRPHQIVEELTEVDFAS